MKTKRKPAITSCHNPAYPCSCDVAWKGNAYHIQYCEQHAIGPVMPFARSAIEAAIDYIGEHGDESEYCKGVKSKLDKAYAKILHHEN